MVHLSAIFLYDRVLTGNDMYCLDGQLACQLSICHDPTGNLHVLPRCSTCLTAVYMTESAKEMICYCLYGTLICQLSICKNPNNK